MPPVATDEIADNAVNSDKLAVNSVITEKIVDGAVTKPKLGYKAVSVTIPAGALSGSSDPDPELVGGAIIGFYPSSVLFATALGSITLSPTGVVGVTILAAGAEACVFVVNVLKQ